MGCQGTLKLLFQLHFKLPDVFEDLENIILVWTATAQIESDVSARVNYLSGNLKKLQPDSIDRICTKIYMNNEIDRKRLDEINEIIISIVMTIEI